MRRLHSVLALCAALMLAGCETPYQSGEGSFTGGYEDMEVTPTLIRVRFSGNGFIDEATVKKYALFRAAEYAKSKNKAWFAVYPNLIAASLVRPEQLVSVGSMANKPTAFLYIQLLDQNQPKAYETEVVLKERDAFLAAKAAASPTAPAPQ